MNKLKQIEALVEEAIEKIEKAGLKDFRNFRKLILTDLAKRSVEIRDVEQPTLKPLPEVMPEWFASYFNGRGNDAVSCYIHCKYTFGTQPREWWMDLKQGDKFMYLKNAYELDAILLRTVNDYTYNIDNCSPYTDPEAELRKTLNPEQIKLLDEMKANTKANTKV